MRYDINTIDELVTALGGDTAVARWIGISQPAVGKWKERNKVPPEWNWRIAAELRRRKLTFHPAVLGIDERDAVCLIGRQCRSTNRASV
jgi:hypothetical protein